MNNFNAVGDIAGNFLTLQALLAKMPQDATLISLGDPNDRGPRNKDVIDFLMTNGRTVNSNHAHMLVDEYQHQATPGALPRYYPGDIWPYQNGGMTTMESYGYDPAVHGTDPAKAIVELIPYSHFKFLKDCPMFIESDNFVMSHAPIHIKASPQEASELGHGFATTAFDQKSENSILWNRLVPTRPNHKLNGKVNIFGHNSSNKVKMYTEEYPTGIKVDQAKLTELWNKRDEYKVWAICLDTSGGGFLTGLHLPTMTLFEQPIID